MTAHLSGCAQGLLPRPETGSHSDGLGGMSLGRGRIMATSVQLQQVLGIIERLEGDVHYLKEAVERACRSQPETGAPTPLDDVEREHIMDVLRQTGGNRVAAARALGISRRSLYRRLERHGIDYGARPRAGALLHD